LKSLSRIKEVRHPFLLSLERFEIVDGQLFIVTELADMSLMDRYMACRGLDGRTDFQSVPLRGIPREELLAYLRDAADALDFMNENYSLQHLDIKPQKLLLVGGRIKIADFGLVKNLRGSSATATGGVTPVYAPPKRSTARSVATAISTAWPLFTRKC
jgi:serine/threonine protein kinase